MADNIVARGGGNAVRGERVNVQLEDAAKEVVEVLDYVFRHLTRLRLRTNICD